MKQIIFCSVAFFLCAQSAHATIHTYVNKTPYDLTLFVGYKKCTGIGHRLIVAGDSTTENPGMCELASVQGHWVHRKDIKNKDSYKLTHFRTKGNATFTFIGATQDTFEPVETPEETPLFTSGNSDDDRSVTIMSANVYAFPVATRDILKGTTSVISKISDSMKEIDLVEGVDTPILQRIDKIAYNVIAKELPDVIVFQEIWGTTNKARMVENLKKLYPFSYYNNTLYGFNPAKKDDGLLMVSKLPFFCKEAITYADKLQEEEYSQKGALVVALYDKKGRPFILVNTHLQSGTSWNHVFIKRAQMLQIAQKINEIKKRFPQQLHNAPIMIVGDLNEPIVYQEGVETSIYKERRFIDRTKYLVDLLNENGILVSNDQVLGHLATLYKPTHIVEIFQLTNAHQQYNPSDPTKRTPLELSLPQNEHVYGVFQGHKNAPWSYWPVATVLDGWQILDHFFLDKKSKLLSYRVLREEMLGDTMNKKGVPDDQKVRANGKVALADHAAVIAKVLLQ